MGNLRVGVVEHVFGEGVYLKFDVKDILCGQICRFRIRQGRYLAFDEGADRRPFLLTDFAVKDPPVRGNIVCIPQGVILPDVRNPHLWWAYEWYLPRPCSVIFQNL